MRYTYRELLAYLNISSWAYTKYAHIQYNSQSAALLRKWDLNSSIQFQIEEMLINPLAENCVELCYSWNQENMLYYMISNWNLIGKVILYIYCSYSFWLSIQWALWISRTYWLKIIIKFLIYKKIASIWASLSIYTPKCI